MNFEKEYKKINNDINPSSHLENKTLISMQRQKKTPILKIAGISAAACITVVLIVFGSIHLVPGSNSNNLITQSPVSTNNAHITSPSPTQTNKKLELNGNPIKYSELGLDLKTDILCPGLLEWEA